MEILFRQEKTREILGYSLLDRLGIHGCLFKEIDFARDRSRVTKKSHYHTSIEIHIIQSKQLGVIRKGLTVGIDLLCHLPAKRIGIHDVFDRKVPVLRTAVVCTVNVLTASSLANDGNVQFFHVASPLSMLHTLYNESTEM